MTTAENVAAEFRGPTVHLVESAITLDYYWPTTRRNRLMSTVSYARKAWSLKGNMIAVPGS